MSFLEIAAIALNILSVYLVIHNHKANWWVGLIGVMALFFFFWEKQLFGQVLVQGVFAFQTLYGILAWEKDSEIKFVDKHNVRWYDALAVILTFVGLVLVSVFNGGLDYATAVLAMYATYVMARKFLQHWIIWMLVDVVSVAMFIHLEMYGMTLLYCVFFAMCIFGLRQWEREYSAQERAKYVTF